MRFKHTKYVKVRISRRTLWVDKQAYPLSQITRVQPLEFPEDRRRMAQRLVLTYCRRAGATIALGLVGLVFLGCLGNAVPPAATALFAVVMLAILAAHTVRLVRRLTLPTLHILSVSTSGVPSALLFSTDKEKIHELVDQIVEAIDNPSAEYSITIENVQNAEVIYGDKVGGDKYAGDHVRGDKILGGSN